MYRKNGPSTLTKGHEGSISSCCISDDSTLCVSGGYDTRIVLWDMVHFTPKLILRVKISKNKNLIDILRILSIKNIYSFGFFFGIQGHQDWINDVTLTSDNSAIVSVGKDKVIREYDIEHCDNIKLVMEQYRTLGNKLIRVS